MGGMRHFVKRLVAGIVASLMFASPAAAHPGSGIVVDRNGNVFFVMLGSSAIMKLSRDGSVRVLVDDERLRLPHHLVLGRDGALYAASDVDGKVWRVGADGSLREHFNSKRVPRAPRPGAEVHVGAFGDPFTLDSAGNVYALGSASDSTLIRIALDGTVTPLAVNAKFGGLHFSSMTWGLDGALYVSDKTRVWRIVGDSATAIVPSGVALFRATGLAVDREGNIYVAPVGAFIGLLYWMGQDVFIFSYARHAILALFALGALRSGQRARQPHTL